jgi:hypothetical protein
METRNPVIFALPNEIQSFVSEYYAVVLNADRKRNCDVPSNTIGSTWRVKFLGLKRE